MSRITEEILAWAKAALSETAHHLADVLVKWKVKPNHHFGSLVIGP